MQHTFTLNECCDAFRANGIPMTASTLAEMLEQGKLPFGYAVRGRQLTTLIFKEAFYQWLKEKINEDVRRI